MWTSLKHFFWEIWHNLSFMMIVDSAVSSPNTIVLTRQELAQTARSDYSERLSLAPVGSKLDSFY